MVSLRQLFKRPFLYLSLAIIGLLLVGELGISNVPNGTQDFATIPDVSVDALSNRVVPRQVASGVTRGSQATPGTDGKPQVLMGNQQTFGNGFFVAKPGVDVLANTDPANLIFNSNQNVFKIALSGIATMNQVTASSPSYVGIGRVTITHNLGIVPVVIAIYAQNSIPDQYNLWADNSGTVAGGTSGVQFSSFHVRTITATTTTVTFEEDYYWGGFPAIATAGPYTIKYYLLQESAN